MHYMHDLKDLLCAELEDYAEKGKKSGKMSMGDLESIHKLTDTVKNILKINMLDEESGYSEDGQWMGEGRMYGTSYTDGSSYRRGRGRNAKRDSMGRYSRESGYSEDHAGRNMGNRGGIGRNMGNGGNRGYSRDGAKDYMLERIEEMMDEAETPKQREALQKCMQALERA